MRAQAPPLPAVRAIIAPSTPSIIRVFSSKLFKMQKVALVSVMLVVVVALGGAAHAMALSQEQKERFINDLDLVDDDGSVETALMNYLFAKQIVSRLHSQLDVSDLQRKRSYWKQCAFNAVSCFGK